MNGLGNPLNQISRLLNVDLTKGQSLVEAERLKPRRGFRTVEDRHATGSLARFVHCGILARPDGTRRRLCRWRRHPRRQ